MSEAHFLIPITTTLTTIGTRIPLNTLSAMAPTACQHMLEEQPQILTYERVGIGAQVPLEGVDGQQSEIGVIGRMVEEVDVYKFPNLQRG